MRSRSVSFEGSGAGGLRLGVRKAVDGFAAEFGGDAEIPLSCLDTPVASEGLDVSDVAAGLQ